MLLKATPMSKRITTIKINFDINHPNTYTEEEQTQEQKQNMIKQIKVEILKDALKLNKFNLVRPRTPSTILNMKPEL